jgi:hypothetical protein
MELIIWNKISSDNIDVLLLDGLIKVKLNNKDFWSKKFDDINKGIKIYNEILNKLEKINEAYYKENKEEYKRLSEEFFDNLKIL